MMKSQIDRKVLILTSGRMVSGVGIVSKTIIRGTR